MDGAFHILGIEPEEQKPVLGEPLPPDVVELSTG